MRDQSINNQWPVSGAGLGLRRGMLDELASGVPKQVDFFEIAPENWIGVGGAWGKALRALTEQRTFIAHGLSLSIGSPAPLDESYLHDLKRFLDEHRIPLFRDHLSYCGDDGHLYDLLPIPFTEEAVHYVAGRIRRVQDILERPIAMENVSYYAAPGQEMQEIDFLRAVLDEADCGLLLDVNNIYVNSVNHDYDAETFLTTLPASRVRYFHLAGHYTEAADLLVDTHGADVCSPVWKLLEKAYAHCGPVPTLLERDFNIPPLAELCDELDQVHQRQRAARPEQVA